MVARTTTDAPASGRPERRLTGPELAAWRGLLRVHASLVRELDSELIAAHDLPLGSYEVLLTLADAPERRMRMAELADSVLLSRSGLTRMCDRLAREGLIDRCASPSDARGSYAVLTEAGHDRFQEAQATHLAGVRRLFTDHFDRDELELLGRLWERVLPGASS